MLPYKDSKYNNINTNLVIRTNDYLIFEFDFEPKVNFSVSAETNFLSASKPKPNFGRSLLTLLRKID